LSRLAQIVNFAGFADIGAMPSSQDTGRPQDLPASLMDPVEPSQEDTHSPPKLRTPMSLIEDLISKSKTAVVLCLEFLGAMYHSQLDSCDHHFFYQSPTTK